MSRYFFFGGLSGIQKLPEIPFPGITIRNLLTHTGGLPDYDDEDGWVVKKSKEENKIFGNEIIIRFLAESGEKAKFAPGEKYEYSNTGYCVLAQIVEKVSGVKFEDFLRKNIFEPAGMHSTRTVHRRKDGVTPNDVVQGMVLDMESGEFKLPDYVKEEDFVIPLDGENGDGLVHSSILDLFTWDRVLRTDRILTEEERKLMYTPGRLNNRDPTVDEDDIIKGAYGFGWDILDDPDLGKTVFHSGGWPGSYSWYQRWIDADKVLVIIRSRTSLDVRAFYTMFEALQNVAKDKEPCPVRTIEEIALKDPDKSRWEAFCGKYEKPEDDELWLKEVFVRNGELYARFCFGSVEKDMRMYPLGENEFGIKLYSFKTVFGDASVTYADMTCKKL